MRQDSLLDEERIRKAVSILKAENELFEIRIISKRGKKTIISGYFTDVNTLISAFDTVDVRNSNVYISVNQLDPAIYSRDQHDKFIAGASTTSDSEVKRYEWLFIDIDPERPEGVSSSDAELACAYELDAQVYDFLKMQGFSEPVRAKSGNGVHQLYKIDFENTEENKLLVKDVLEVLSNKFSNTAVKIDTVNFNPSRIMKLYGTLAQKGSSTEARPHRMSEIVSIPEKILINDKSILEKLTNQFKTSEPIIKETQEKFDLEGFMLTNGIQILKTGTATDSIEYFLEECPFDSSHKNGDARIFQYSNGAISFKCHHNSCKNYRWQDVRRLFEPNAYIEKENRDERIESGFQKYVKRRKERIQQVEYSKTKSKPKHKIRQLKKVSDLLVKNLPDPKVIVGVGDEAPLLVEGTCILSAKPKMGKSWLVLDMCIKVANGEDFLGYKTNKCSTLYLDLETSENLQQKRVKKILQGAKAPENFYLETETNNLDDGFVEQIEAYLKEDPNIGLIVVDVFQLIRSNQKKSSETDYEHTYRDISPLNAIAQKYHISIILVCHDRKAQDTTDPFANILGSTGLQGAATQMMIMHRTSKEKPITLEVKGKAIDGLPELEIEQKDGRFVVKSGANEYIENRIKSENIYNSVKRLYEMINDNERLPDYLSNKKYFTAKDIKDFSIYNSELDEIVETYPKINGWLRNNINQFQKDGIEISFYEGHGIYIKKSQKSQQ